MMEVRKSGLDQLIQSLESGRFDPPGWGDALEVERVSLKLSSLRGGWAGYATRLKVTDLRACRRYKVGDPRTADFALSAAGMKAAAAFIKAA